MPVVSLELNAKQDAVALPIIWRLGKLFNVVTNVRRARVTDDYGYVLLEVEGSNQEIDQAKSYLAAQHLIPNEVGISTHTTRPEDGIPQPNAISVRLSTSNPAQAHAPLLYRVGKDFNTVVNLLSAQFDEEDGGWVEVVISGILNEVQRSIAYLHTTGIHVNPLQRSVTDYSNL